MNIPEEATEAAIAAAVVEYREWRQMPNREAYVNLLANNVARRAVEAATPLIAAQVLRDAAADLRACQTCGRAHRRLTVGQPGRIDLHLWVADPDDGHNYRPVQMHGDEFAPWLNDRAERLSRRSS
jgi:hypothetical protein